MTTARMMTENGHRSFRLARHARPRIFTLETPMNSEPLAVAISRLPHGRDLPLPAYQSEHAAGMDLVAAIDASITLAPSQSALVPCGIAVAIPLGYEGQVRPRSGLATKHNVLIPNAPGTIDADYRGEVKVALLNLGAAAVTITRGMRFAQLVIAPVSRVSWREQDALSDTPRGSGGFGHTGPGPTCS